MIADLRTVDDHGVTYQALMFVCPGCAEDGSSGLHMLPVNTTAAHPAWIFNGNLAAPTLSPSILSHYANTVCHSFLEAGHLRFLDDCTHSLAGTTVPLPELPAWVLDD